MVTAPRFFARMAVLSVLLGGGMAEAAQPPVSAAPELSPGHTGFVRLAHLSPDTPAVDVYLYGSSKTPQLILRHVAYGAASPYQRISDGTYEVAMRPADAAASSPPVLSTKVTVEGNESYTVAGMGPYKSIKLQVLHDTFTPGAGQAGIRIIEASLKTPSVNVTAGGQPVAQSLQFPQATSYSSLPGNAADTKVAVTGSAGSSATTSVKLGPGTLHTIIVLDGAQGLKLLDLADTTGGAVTPTGGVDTGLGGLAPRPSRPAWPFPLAALGLATALTATIVIRRRHTALLVGRARRPRQ